MIDTSQGGTDPQFVTDAAGNRIAVLLDLDRYNELLDALDELDAIRAFDEAKTEREDAIPFDQALREIDRERRSP